jgi:hypothetical protein
VRALAGTVWIVLAVSVAAQAQRYDPDDDLRAYRPQNRALRKQCKAQRDELARVLRQREQEGRPTACSKQILNEVKWLVSYTTDYDRAWSRLGDLRATLDQPDHTQHLRQSSADGSWGTCCQEWFFKLDATVDRLIVMNAIGQEPEHPLKLLERINSPGELRQYLDSILVSNIRATGVDHRKELNHSVSALVRLIPGSVRSGFKFHPELEQTLWDYLDNTWQNPDTGYWGAWYRQDEKIIKTDDLSITFHIVSYRQGRVSRWPQIIATTLAIRELEYPYGWLEDAEPTNHHNYDVVTLFRYGWPHMSPALQAEVSGAISQMLSWCLTTSLRKDGTFGAGRSSGLAETAYFGISFLEEVGYFSKERRFWTDEDFPESQEVRQRLFEAALKLDPYDQHTLFALGKLMR